MYCFGLIGANHLKISHVYKISWANYFLGFNFILFQFQQLRQRCDGHLLRHLTRAFISFIFLCFPFLLIKYFMFSYATCPFLSVFLFSLVVSHKTNFSVYNSNQGSEGMGMEVNKKMEFSTSSFWLSNWLKSILQFHWL